MTTEWTPERVEATSPEGLPQKLGRFRHRKGESDLQWKARILQMFEEGRITIKVEVSRKDEYAERDASSLDALRLLGLSEEEIRRAADPPKRIIFETRTEELQQETDPTELGGLWEGRRLVYEWLGVEGSYELKREEARCDLDCWSCQSAAVLACLTDNVTSAAEDGIDFESFLLGGAQ